MRGDVPKWTLAVQVMPEVEASQVPRNPIDPTRIRPHKDYPRPWAFPPRDHISVLMDIESGFRDNQSLAKTG